MIETAPLQIQI